LALKSEFWVQAFMRQAALDGLFCALRKRGAPEAGAVFVLINRLDGTCRLLGPAPGPAYGEAGERRFIEELPSASDCQDCEALLARRKSFDQDIWIVEVEDRSGNAGLTVAS
jgi:hypothetical protein